MKWTNKCYEECVRLAWKKDLNREPWTPTSVERWHRTDLYVYQKMVGEEKRDYVVVVPPFQ